MALLSLKVFGYFVSLLIAIALLNPKFGPLWTLSIIGGSIACYFVFNKVAEKYKLDGAKIKKVIGVTALFVFAGWYVTSTLSDSFETSPAPETHIATVEEKAVAQQDLKNTMDLAMKSGLVTSYEFSDTKRVVYAGSVWYTQTVAFKKDFLGSIAMSLKTSTGHHRFEVLDAYSNQKVAEVTAFSGSIEVYR